MFTPATPTELTIDAEHLARLGVVVSRLARSFRVASAPHGLTPSQLSVLATVVRHGPVGLKALAEREGVNPTLLSRIVSALEGGGLLRRSASGADRRCVTVAATPAGRRLQARVRAGRTEALAKRLGEIDVADAERVLAAVPALERLADVTPRAGSKRA